MKEPVSTSNKITDRDALMAAFTELAATGGAGAIVRSCCRSCAMWGLPATVKAASTWVVLADLDGRSDPKTITAAGWFKENFASLSWGGDINAIAAALRNQGFWVSVPADDKSTIAIASLRYKTAVS